MPYNIPEYDTKQISIGRGRLFINKELGSSVGWVDIGACRDAEVTITREKIEVEQGMPALKVETYNVRSDVTFTITGIQWNLENIAHILGLPEQVDKLSVVPRLDFKDVALIFVHEMPSGSFLMASIFKAKGGGEITVTFTDDVHEIPYSFTAMSGGKDFVTGDPKVDPDGRPILFEIEKRPDLPLWFAGFYT